MLDAGARPAGALSDTLTELVDEGHPRRGLHRRPQVLQRSRPLRRNGIRSASSSSASPSRTWSPRRRVSPRPAYFPTWRRSPRSWRCCAASRSAPTSPTPRLPVRLIGHHAGITLGFYGTSHHATEDLAIMRAIADLSVVAPADAASARSRAPGDSGHRTADLLPHRPRSRSAGLSDELTFELGKAVAHDAGRTSRSSRRGQWFIPRSQAASALRAEGRSVGVLDMHTVKPIDARRAHGARARAHS